MSRNPDRMEEAFNAMRARSCERAKYDVTLEERIMQEFGNVQRSRRRRTGWMVAGVALLISAAGFSTAGGVEAVKQVKQWLTVEFTDINGNSSTLRLIDGSGATTGKIHLHSDGPEEPENAPSDGP